MSDEDLSGKLRRIAVVIECNAETLWRMDGRHCNAAIELMVIVKRLLQWAGEEETKDASQA